MIHRRIGCWMAMACLASLGGAWAPAAEPSRPARPAVSPYRQLMRELMNNSSSPLRRVGDGHAPAASVPPRPVAGPRPGGKGVRSVVEIPPPPATIRNDLARPAVKAAATTRPAPRVSTTRPAPRVSTTRPAPRVSTTRPTTAKPQAAAAAAAAARPDDLADRMQLLDLAGMKQPVKVADTLFVDGQHRAARVIYEMALKASPDDETRGWILLQLANCHRHSDPAKATALYAQVAKEFPQSPWASAATMLSRLVEWNQKNTPRKALKEVAEIKGGESAAPDKTTTDSWWIWWTRFDRTF